LAFNLQGNPLRVVALHAEPIEKNQHCYGVLRPAKAVFFLFFFIDWL
jgi:hypothetical protein